MNGKTLNSLARRLGDDSVESAPAVVAALRWGSTADQWRIARSVPILAFADLLVIARCAAASARLTP